MIASVPHDHAGRPSSTFQVRFPHHSRVHLIGIAGSGMRSLADVLSAAGWQVSGSDLELDPALVGRFAVRGTHHADAIDKSVDLVIHSVAVPADNVELARARTLKIPCRTYPQIVAELMHESIE